MSDKLDRWGKWKREAIRDYDRRSSEYLRTKSPGEIVLNELEKSKLLSRLPWYERLRIKAAAWHGEFSRKDAAAGHLVAEAAAQLAPDTKWGVIFDVASTVGPLAALKILKVSKVGRVAGRYGPTGKAVFEALQDVHKAKGLRDLARSGASVQKARQIVRGAELAKESIEATKIGLKAVKGLVPLVGGSFAHRPRFGAPSTPISQQIKPDSTRQRRRTPRVRSRPIPKGPSYSFLDPVKVADWTLQSMREPSKLTTGRPFKPFRPVIDRLAEIEKKGQRQIAEQRRMGNLLNRFQRSISKPQPFDAHATMRQKYGAKIDAIAAHTPKFTPRSAVMSPQDWQSLQKKLGIGPSARIPSRPFNWRSTAVPPQHLQTKFHPERPGQAGWGMEVHRSRPASNLLRQMGKGLMNPNRARPMPRPMGPPGGAP
jgi:hypothetical protein